MDSELRETIGQVRKYLADRELLADFVAPPEPARQEGRETDRGQVRATADRLPLTFEANQGQADKAIDYLARGLGYRLYLKPNEVLLVTAPVSEIAVPSTTVVRMQLLSLA